MTTSKLIQLEQRIKAADDFSEVNDAFDDATKFDHVANSIQEAAELLGVEEAEISEHLVISEELFLSDACHMIGGNSYCAHFCVVRVWELYADSGSEDYIYMLDVKNA